MQVPFIVGAYASLPSNKLEKEEYYRLLAQQECISGIEIPFPGDFVEQLPWLSKQIAAHWEHSTITAIPGTMQNLGKNPDFGLASPDSEGRESALKFMEQIRIATNELADLQGRSVIKAVEIHSAPTYKADKECFMRSLEAVLQQDWAGAKLVIEHCDAPRKGQKPEKGFLEIEDEIAVAKAMEIGIHLNWGRSCLEDRNPQTPAEHIKKARKAGVLTGLMFSGASPQAGQYGYEWIDGHLPASPDEPSSLMSGDVIAECVSLALGQNPAEEQGKPVAYLGAKICVPPTATLGERINMLSTIWDICLQK